MAKNKIVHFLVLYSIFSISVNYCLAQNNKDVVVGAERISNYILYLKNKKVALFVNQSSILLSSKKDEYIHLIDTLLSLGVNIKKIFTPEHGLSGNIQNGVYINKEKKYSGIEIISTYNLKDDFKPNDKYFNDIDILIYDIQDVGARFYTYISSLEYILTACINNHIDFIILDRPNPNGHYIDGPVLDTSSRSFVGRQPIPIVYGMTSAEYAKMLIGEKWLEINTNRYHKTKWKNFYFLHYSSFGFKNISFSIVPCKNYNHQKKYSIPINPSPNLPNDQSIQLYPSLCFFEGTVIHIGRGSPFPFQCYGSENFPTHLFNYAVIENKNKKELFGYDLRNYFSDTNRSFQLEIKWLIQAYQLYPQKEKFFLSNLFFDKLAGTSLLRQQILMGFTEIEIRDTWKKGIEDFKKIRKKYLIYK